MKPSLYSRKRSDRLKMPRMLVGMRTWYFWRNLLSSGTMSLDAVLNSNFSLKAEMLPIVVVTTLILSTRNLETSAVASSLATAIPPVNRMSTI